MEVAFAHDKSTAAGQGEKLTEVLLGCGIVGDSSRLSGVSHVVHRHTTAGEARNGIDKAVSKEHLVWPVR